MNAVKTFFHRRTACPALYGDGAAAEKYVNLLQTSGDVSIGPAKGWNMQPLTEYAKCVQRSLVLVTGRKNPVRNFHMNKLRQLRALKSCTVLLLTTLLLGGLGGGVSSAAGAQEGSGSSRANLSRMVVVGDSLSAGFQNASLLDTQQPHGWANVLAVQANVPLIMPLVAPPGIPNVLELLSVGSTPVIVQIPGASLGRDNPFLLPTDLAVPGATLQDALINLPSAPIDDLTDLILGLPGLLVNPPLSQSQVDWAVDLKPTTIFVWIGNNDILAAATAANPSRATPLSSFVANYKTLMDRLASTGATLIVANIPDVTVIPFFTPASTIAEEAGLPLFVIGPILGIGLGDYVLPTGIARIPFILSNPSLGPLPARDVLRAVQVFQIRAIIDVYNLIIAVEAAAHGAVLVDIHSLVDRLRLQGVEVNGVHLTNRYLGGLFSLDGIHPTNTGYAVIANEFIATLNQARGNSIPLVDLDQVASSDPLVFADVTSASSLGMHVDPSTAGSVLSLLLRAKTH